MLAFVVLLFPPARTCWSSFLLLGSPSWAYDLSHDSSINHNCLHMLKLPHQISPSWLNYLYMGRTEMAQFQDLKVSTRNCHLGNHFWVSSWLREAFLYFSINVSSSILNCRSSPSWILRQRTRFWCKKMAVGFTMSPPEKFTDHHSGEVGAEKCNRQMVGRKAVKYCLLDMTWPLHSWTHSCCVCLHKTLKTELIHILS